MPMLIPRDPDHIYHRPDRRTGPADVYVEEVPYVNEPVPEPPPAPVTNARTRIMNPFAP